MQVSHVEPERVRLPVRVLPLAFQRLTILLTTQGFADVTGGRAGTYLGRDGLM